MNCCACSCSSSRSGSSTSSLSPKPGERPDVVCLVAHELRSGQTLRLWRDQLGAAPPYRTDAKVLFVCFVATAELACHLASRLAVTGEGSRSVSRIPCLVNGRTHAGGQGPARRAGLFRPRFHQHQAKRRDAQAHSAGLAVHCRGARTDPGLLRERHRSAASRCWRSCCPTIDLNVALYRGESVAAAAVMEHRGVPIDMDDISAAAGQADLGAVRDAMVPAIDAKYGVYVKGKDGEWSFNMELFKDYLARKGIDWPRLETGKLNLRRKTFESMCKGYPELEDLRQLRYARDKMRRIKLAVGADGRNRTVLWPFQAKTSRTQPKASQWIFSPAVWLRSLIKPGPGLAVAYID